MNEAITVIGGNARVLDNPEQSLGKQVSLIEKNATGVIISDDASYAQAAEITKTIKQMQKKVKDYWEPLRVSAKKTYDDVLGKKKAMMDPLDKAEKILKGKMGGYTAAKERERKAREEAVRKAAQEETDRKLAEAAAAEKNGDLIGAEMAMAEAEIMDDASASITVMSKVPKVEGVSTTKNWEIKSIDLSKVPVELAGVLLRPVDEKAALRLIRASKGTIQIPGIEYEETYAVSIRA